MPGRSDATLSRLEILQSVNGENYAPDMPEIDARYLIEYLYEIGPVMAEGTLTHTEIEKWQRNTGIRLSVWESRTIKRLSVEFLAQSRRSDKADCPAPWDETQDVIPNQKTESVRDALRQLANL